MKKIMFILVAVLALTVTSCSKESQINRKLDGSWTAVTYNGEAVQSGYAFDVTFSKNEKANGTGNSTYTIPGFPSVNVSFTYVLAEDKLTWTETSSSDSYTVTINTYTKDKIQWTDSEGEITVLQPK